MDSRLGPRFFDVQVRQRGFTEFSDRTMADIDYSASSGASARILIVEANEENRTLLKLLHEANGFCVALAGDGVEALAAARFLAKPMPTVTLLREPRAVLAGASAR